MSVLPAKEAKFLHEIEMGLGAWSWGDRVFWNYGHGYTDDDIAAAFQVSLDSGVNLVDTAEIYGNGRSERLLGKFIQETDQPVWIATKFFPIPYRITKNSVLRALRGSLERLGLERVHLYQLHWPSPIVPISVYVEGLALAVKEGLSRTVGVSNYDANQMQKAYDLLQKSDIPLASNQVEYSLINRTVEKNGLLDLCKNLGIRLIAYSPLGMGLLTGKYTPENPPPGVRGRKYNSILAELQELIKVMKEIGQAHEDKSASQVALNWVICKGAMPIPGAKTATQASQNAGALGWKLTSEEIHLLDEASDRLPG